MILLNAIGLVLWMIVIPVCIGLIPMQLFDPANRKPGMTFIAGYLMMFVSFELLTVPIVLNVQYDNFKWVRIGFTVLALLLAVVGVGMLYQNYKKKSQAYWESYSLPGHIGIWLVVLAVLLFMLVMVVVRSHFNGDDAYYVVQSLIAQQSDTMYTRSPYLGGSTPLDMRHAMAVFTMWVSFLGSATGIHTTILSHTILPLVLIPLTLLIYLQIGQRLLRDKQEMLPYFMLFMEALQIFGNVSIYTTETFLITRTWQGKSLAANVLFPIVIWGMLLVYDKTEERIELGPWLLMLLADAATGLCSSLAVILCSMLILCCGFFISIREKKFRILINSCLCCVPGGIYVLFYFLVAH